MGNPDYSALVARQREYFLSGSTRPAAWRKARLEAVKALFTENHDELCEALWKDLRRNVTDADLMDVAYNVKDNKVEGGAKPIAGNWKGVMAPFVNGFDAVTVIL